MVAPMANPAEWMRQAQAALERQNYPLAVDRLQRVLAERAHDLEAARLLAMAQRERGDMLAAEEALVSALRINGQSEDAIELWLELADLRLLMGRPQDAARACRHALAHSPNQWEGYYLLGNCFVDARAMPEAVKAYREALELNPFEREIWHNLRVAYVWLDDAHGMAEVDEALARMRPAED